MTLHSRDFALCPTYIDNHDDFDSGASDSNNSDISSPSASHTSNHSRLCITLKNGIKIVTRDKPSYKICKLQQRHGF